MIETRPNTVTSYNENNPPPHTHRRGFWAKVLFTFAMYPLLLVVTAVVESFEKPHDATTINFYILAYWGLLLGLMRKSLLRMIVGLNLGVVLNFIFDQYLDLGLEQFANPSANPNHISIFNYFNYVDKWTNVFILCGIALCCVTCFDRKRPYQSTLYNAIVGLIAFAIMEAITPLIFRAQISFSYYMPCIYFMHTIGAAILVWFLGEERTTPVQSAVQK